MTEHRTAAPCRSPTVLELRLYVIALLAAVYVIAWRAIAPRAPSAVPPDAPAPVAAAPSVVWLDDVPIAQRPAVTLPAGWRVASRSEAAANAGPPAAIRPAVDPAPRRIRVTPERARRVRTRSS